MSEATIEVAHMFLTRPLGLGERNKAQEQFKTIQAII